MLGGRQRDRAVAQVNKQWLPCTAAFDTLDLKEAKALLDDQA
jgi:hypothetical protein